MRPDEHKKKKSAQYQRKHGSSAAKGGKNENDKTSSKPGKQGASKNEASERTSRTRRDHQVSDHSQEKTKIDSTSESEEEGEQKDHTPTKTFRRREITSNWTKYDLPPADADDDAATTKGDDFHKLLLCAGTAMSHFRFKDEESWEEAGVSESGPGAQVLSLDCAELATSLNCLPLYTQLGLDTDIFSSEQLTAMEKTVEENCRTAGLPVPRPKTEPKSPTSPARVASSSPAPVLPPDPPGGVGHAMVSESREGKGAVREQKRENKVTDVKAGSGPDFTVKNDAGRSAGFTDDDLDSLLESDDVIVSSHPGSEGGMVRSPGAEVRGRSSEGQTQLSAAGPEVTDQDLDDLLAMELPQSSRPATVADPGPKTSETKIAVESAELEDWLDSVLDD